MTHLAGRPIERGGSRGRSSRCGHSVDWIPATGYREQDVAVLVPGPTLQRLRGRDVGNCSRRTAGNLNRFNFDRRRSAKPID